MFSGQQDSMATNVVTEIGLPIDVQLVDRDERRTWTEFFGSAVDALGRTFAAENPDLVLAQGDTLSVAAASVSSFLSSVAFGHVEAGLRTKNLRSPFPEEFVRRTVSVSSTLNFAPGNAARRNLVEEGVTVSSIHVVGNPVIDLIKSVQPKNLHLRCVDDGLPKRLVLMTLHRHELRDSNMSEILRAIDEVARRHPDVRIIFPVHGNAEVARIVQRSIGNGTRIQLVSPLRYWDFVNLMMNATLVITDSGGVQEEAPSMGVPTLVVRDQTERMESVLAGSSILAGTDPAQVATELDALLGDNHLLSLMSIKRDIYGDGRASERIANIVARHLGVKDAKQLPPFADIYGQATDATSMHY